MILSTGRGDVANDPHQLAPFRIDFGGKSFRLCDETRLRQARCPQMPPRCTCDDWQEASRPGTAGNLHQLTVGWIGACVGKGSKNAPGSLAYEKQIPFWITESHYSFQLHWVSHRGRLTAQTAYVRSVGKRKSDILAQCPELTRSKHQDQPK